MKKKTVAFIIGALMLALSSCDKDTLLPPFWTEANKYEFQHSVFSWSNGSEVEFIRLGDWDSQKPNTAKAKMYKGILGGQMSFSDTAKQENYTLITDSVQLTGVYADNSIRFDNGLEVIVISSAYSSLTTNDVRHIKELIIAGKVYKPYSFNTAIALPYTSGIGINKMIARDKLCSFVTCVNGVSQHVNWEITADNKMKIYGSFGSINADVIQPTEYSSPILVSSDGRSYILQLYTTSSTNNAMCSCSARFKLYAMPVASSYKTTAASLIIGDC